MVSVLIACYNSSLWLANCINSALHQQYLREIIIVDDFSTDESWDIIQDFQLQYPDKIKGVRNQVKGNNIARNLAFSLSSGSYIQWLDADDVLLPNKLEIQVAYLQRHPEVHIAYCDWRQNKYDKEMKLIQSEVFIERKYDDFLYELVRNNWRPTHAYLMRRIICNKIHNIGWNPGTPIAQDREYFTLAGIHGAHFGYTPGILMEYNHKASNSISSSMPFSQKSVVLVRLFTYFMKEMDAKSWIAEDKKKLYVKVLYSQKVYLSTYFGIPVEGKKLRLNDIKWSLIPGAKPKSRIIRNLLFKNN